MKPRIGVLTSGGDCPGLNAVLRVVVLAVEKLGWKVSISGGLTQRIQRTRRKFFDS